MAVKYFCDCCGKEVEPASATNPKPIGTMEIVNPLTGKSESLMVCQLCVPNIREYINGERGKNKLEAMKEESKPSSIIT